MKHKLAYRLAVTYGLIFILAVAVIDTALIIVYRDNQLKKNESFYFDLSSMLSTMVKNNIRITNYINTSEENGDRNAGRVLLLDASGKVLLDSGGELSGVSMTNLEYRKALENGKPAAGYYTYGDKGMAMFSYPVSIEGKTSAVVMISVFIQDIYDDINRFAIQVIATSFAVAFAVVIVSVLMGKRLSEPIVRLTAAAGQIYKGKMDTIVEVARNDEIGRLAGAFNRMSSELLKVETGRKRFLSDVSHELKTPLASIKALVEPIISGAANEEESREYLQDIDHEIDRLSGLVGSLLTSARLEEVELKRQELILAEEVDYTVRVLAPLAAQKQIVLENACDRTIVIQADRSMFREVLINLLDNSIKYGIEGGFTRVECTRKAFKVIDNGCGIPEEDLPGIFDSFYRADKSRTGASGSGIGLFIVKRIIELHGFGISAVSQPGKGSEFTVTFYPDV